MIGVITVIFVFIKWLISFTILFSIDISMLKPLFAQYKKIKNYVDNILTSIVTIIILNGENRYIIKFLFVFFNFQ